MFIKYFKIFYPTEFILKAYHVKKFQEKNSYSFHIENDNLTKIHDEVLMDCLNIDTGEGFQENCVVLNHKEMHAIQEPCQGIVFDRHSLQYMRVLNYPIYDEYKDLVVKDENK